LREANPFPRGPNRSAEGAARESSCSWHTLFV
jgi:hypothetical protein